MRGLGLSVFGLAVLFLPPSPAPACSLCGPYAGKSAFVPQYWLAHAVVCGTLANPKLDGNTGAGTTELRIDKRVKDDPRLKGINVFILPRYLTVLSPKEPPRFIALLDDKLQCIGGRADYSPALLDFLAASEAVKGKPRNEKLAHFAKYLDSADASVAEEAFMQFAQASDREVLDAAKSLKPDVFRKLVQDQKLVPERLALFAFLLGATGTPADADLLAPYLRKPDDRACKALDGILAGYILIKPKEGWAWAHSVVGDPKQSFFVRWGTVKAVRFLQRARPEQYHKEFLHTAGLMIQTGELADVAISDLERAQIWDHTKLILAQYGKKSHTAPIVRNALVRYAIVCPLPEARDFVNQLRQREPKLVRELEQDIAFEQGK